VIPLARHPSIPALLSRYDLPAKRIVFLLVEPLKSQQQPLGKADHPQRNKSKRQQGNSPPQNWSPFQSGAGKNRHGPRQLIGPAGKQPAHWLETLDIGESGPVKQVAQPEGGVAVVVKRRLVLGMRHRHRQKQTAARLENPLELLQAVFGVGHVFEDLGAKDCIIAAIGHRQITEGSDEIEMGVVPALLSNGEIDGLIPAMCEKRLVDTLPGARVKHGAARWERLGGSLGTITSGAFYAKGETRIPTRIGVITYTGYVPVKILVFWKFGLPGLALSISGFYLLNLLLQIRYLDLDSSPLGSNADR